MYIPALIKTAAVIFQVLLLIACNNKSKKVTVQEITLQDIKQEERKIEPPPPPPPKTNPPKVEISAAPKKCFVNEGLKYRTLITLYYDDNEAMGIVNSEEPGSGKKRSTGFAGARKGNEYTMEFKQGKPPVIGEGAEWTDKPWHIKRSGGSEILQIIFNAKNIETNKWEEIVFEFKLSDCID